MPNLKNIKIIGWPLLQFKIIKGMADNNQIDQMTPEQLKEAYRVHNLEVTSGFKVLNELEAEGKITLEK